MALLFVAGRAQPRPRPRVGLVGRRRLAVLAPRRRRLALRVHDDLDPAVNVAAARCPLPRRRVAGIVSLTAPLRRRAMRRRRRAAAELGRELFVAQCASCHGVDGQGVEDRGPSLSRRGRGGGRLRPAHRAGCRWPQPDMQASAGPGPLQRRPRSAPSSPTPARSATARPSPTSTRPAGDLAVGGELYRLNCAACHVASGSGAAIGGGRDAPTLMESTPTEIGQAIRIGPGAMPVFGTFSDQDLDDVASYVLDLQTMNATGVDDFGGAGPVAEGLAAWLLALLPLIALTRWIGTPARGPRRAPRAGRATGAMPTTRSSHDVAERRAASTADRSTSGPTGRRSSRSSSPSPAASSRRSATAPTTPATCSGSAWPPRSVGIGFGLVCWAKYLDLDEHVVQQREPLRSHPSPGPRCTTRSRIDGDLRAAQGAAAALRRIFASLLVGFVGPIGSLGPKPRGRARPHVVEGRARGW